MSIPQPIGDQTHIKRGVRLSRKLTRIIWLCMLPLFLFAATLAILQLREIQQSEKRVRSFKLTKYGEYANKVPWQEH